MAYYRQVQGQLQARTYTGPVFEELRYFLNIYKHIVILYDVSWPNFYDKYFSN